jgi:excisionase family DNA binding protein
MQMNQSQQPMNTREGETRERLCYTVEELMEILGVGRMAVYALIHRMAFPAIRISSIGYRIPKETFHAWMYQQ